MDDLISRQAAIEALNKYVDYNDDGEQEINADCVFHTLEDLPSAQPQRMKGKWDARGWNNAYWKCSNCDELTVFPFDFCPFCGSDMRGEEDET